MFSIASQLSRLSDRRQTGCYTTRMKYRAVGFDYGGVLFGQPGPFHSRAIHAAIGVDREAYSEAYHRHYKKRNRGEISWEELHKLVLADLGKSDKLKEVLQIDEEFFGNATVNAPVLAVVDDLHSKGYKTGLLSNNGAELQDAIKQNGVAAHFDVVHISELTGLVKPEPEAFEYFADELEVKLSELVYTDDSRNSLSTADQCGYTPILFENVTQLKKELTNLELLN